MSRVAVWIAVAFCAGIGPAVQAADPENCLLCHRYRGLARIEPETNQIGLYYVDPNYYDRALGAHARLKCTDCHNRDQVGKIPHEPVSPVNCTTACHLATTAQFEQIFSHEGIAAALEGSVHATATLDEANRLLGSPLADDQSRCLLCHDEPTFRWGDHSWVDQAANIARCDVCHTEQLPKDTRFYYWHVHARSRSARSGRDLTRVCAMCHSDPRILEHFKHPDTAASYLASFHGKAMLLGSTETADCLDCHVADLADVHVMKHHNDPAAPTSDHRLPDTCRSAACHPTAGAAISRAAIHLNLGTSRGIEYFIGAVFILVILSTFGPSVLLQAMEMLQIVVGRHDPRHHHHRELADRLKAEPRGREALVRFTPHQRLQHWLLFASFTTLVVTGFPIKFADRAWAGWVVEVMGGLHRARLLHRWAGVVLLVGFAYHLTYVFLFMLRERKRTGKGLVRTFLDLPMCMNFQDMKQLFHLLGYLFFLRKTRPEGARFSLKEKFEYFGVFWGSMLLGITGVLMWANAWTTQHFSGRVLTVAVLIHTFEAFLAFLHVGVIHMIGVFLAPGVFPLSPAMFTGQTPSEELAEAHAGMLEEASRKLGTNPAGEASHG